MAEIVWESDAQSYGFTVMSNGMVWPDDWPGTLVEAQFTSARGDGADLDRDPDMVPSGPGRVTFTPLVRTVGYDGEHGKRIVSLHPFEAVVGDDGYLYTPDEYGQPGIRGIVLPSNNSDVVDEHDWTWRVTFDIPDTTIRPTHIPTPHDHSVDIKDYLDSDANYGVRVVVDTVAATETLTARDEVIQARDEVLPARDQTLAARDEAVQSAAAIPTITVSTSEPATFKNGDLWHHAQSLTLYEWDDASDASASAQYIDGVETKRNYMPNPSFESELNTLNLGTRTTAGRTAFSSGVASGRYGLTIAVEPDANNANAYVAQSFDLSPNLPGKWLAWSLVMRRSGSGLNAVRPYITWGGSVDATWFDGFSLTDDPLTEQQRHTYAILIPEGATLAQIWYRFTETPSGGHPSSGGQAHADDWVITVADTEQDALDWVRTYWDGNTQSYYENTSLKTYTDHGWVELRPPQTS